MVQAQKPSLGMVKTAFQLMDRMGCTTSLGIESAKARLVSTMHACI